MLDPQATLYTTLWLLLEGYAPFAALVKPANRFKTSRPRERDRQADKTAPADYPQVWCGTPDRSAGRGGYVPFDDSPTLVDLGHPLSLNADIDILYDVTDSTLQTPVESAVANALLTHGRKLGLPWVTTSELQRLSRRDETVGGTVRTVTKLRLAVTARPYRSLLINP